jgi:hypothetical protein
MVITITGRPGKGKTLNMVYEAIKDFKKDNSFIKRFWITKILRKEYLWKVNEYSNFPIILKPPKKNKKYKIEDFWTKEIIEVDKIGAYEIRLFDMRIKYNFNEHARFRIDEIQAMYDSMEYKDFPDCIAHFFQAHRHLDYDVIMTNSQSLSRIIKRVLVVTEEYWNIQTFHKFLGWVFVTYKLTWDLSAGNETKIVNDVIAEIEYSSRLFRCNKVFKAYNDKYLAGMKEKGIPYKNVMWKDLVMNYDTIMNTFFPTEEEKTELRNERY